MLKITKSRFYVVPVLMRTLDILEFLRRTNAPLKMHEISMATKVSSTTTYRILRTLVQRGYLVQDLEGRFSIQNRPELKVNSPGQANTANHLRLQKTDLSGDQVIEILDSVLQTLRLGNDASPDQSLPGNSRSPSSKHTSRSALHRA